MKIIRTGMNEQVLKLDDQGLTVARIAAKLKCHPGYVRATRARAGRAAKSLSRRVLEKQITNLKQQMTVLERALVQVSKRSVDRTN